MKNKSFSLSKTIFFSGICMVTVAVLLSACSKQFNPDNPTPPPTNDSTSVKDSTGGNSGNNGNKPSTITWYYDAVTGTLSIYGAGAMENYNVYNGGNNPWNKYVAQIKRIQIGDSVTSIGDAAFYMCTSLTSVTIPNSVTTIGDYAFSDCGLTSITIPNSVTSIGVGAFGDCGLTSITIPNSVTSIDSVAFGACWRLSSVIIGNSVKSIEFAAFAYCDSLTSVTIPNSVTSIGDAAFAYCGSLTSVIIGSSVATIGGSDIILGEGKSGLEGLGAFGECRSLSSVTCLNPTPIFITGAVFFPINDTCVLKVPSGSVALYQQAPEWEKFAHIQGI